MADPFFLHAPFLDNQVDPSTGTIRVRAVLDNPDKLLAPGFFVRVRVPLSAPKPGLLVTDRAVGTDQAQKYVLTLTPTNTVAYQSVKLGPVIDGKRLIRDGLNDGDKIVVNGLQRVRPGMPVTPQTAVAQVPRSQLETARR